MKLAVDIIERLKSYFISRPDVCFAFIFGSYAEDAASKLSDIDIAVYFYPRGKNIEWEETDYWNSSMLDLWVEIESIVGIDVDLVILNLASPLVASSAIRGLPLVIKDEGVFLRFFSIVDNEAEDRRYDLIKGFG